MVRKIYSELVAIRKELQAIRNCLESNGTLDGKRICEELKKYKKVTGASPF